MATMSGSYYEEYNAKSGEYLLYRMPEPTPVKVSPLPILKEAVSVFLGEMMKAQAEGMDEAVVFGSLAAMDQDILERVHKSVSPREAITVLIQYDPRFEAVKRHPKFLEAVLTFVHQYFNKVDADTGSGSAIAENRHSARRQREKAIDIRRAIVSELIEKDVGLRPPEKNAADPGSSRPVNINPIYYVPEPSEQRR